MTRRVVVTAEIETDLPLELLQKAEWWDVTAYFSRQMMGSKEEARERNFPIQGTPTIAEKL